ncbi:MAG TPA: response regulator, partial [Planctomycetota bacterium]|nr:response regulator [Planctomycetota bacterium]
LVDNALKFTAEGEVEVLVEPHCESASHVVFRVRDSGCGIKPESLESIFEAFSQEDSSTSRRFGGTGLGLAICRQIVELMGGTISAASEVGRGSVFSFDCRLVSSSALPQGAGLEIHDASIAPSRVLVVDDNQINRLIGKRMLEKLGCKVLCAEDGADCLRVLTASEVDLVFMDCSMPVMDGFEATRRIRGAGAAYSQVPIIAMTANAMVGDREACLAAGMDEYVTKPIRIRSMREVLQRFRPLDVLA